MADPVPVPLSTPLFRLTQKFNFGRWGWSESYYVAPSDGGDPRQKVERFAENLNIRRKVGLGANVILEACAIDDYKQHGRSALYFAPDIGLGSGPFGECADPWRGYLCKSGDTTGAITDSRIYRGWADERLQSIDPTNPAGAALSTFVRSWADGMKAILSGVQNIAGAMQAQAVMKSFDRGVDGAGLPKPVVAVAVNAAGQLSFTFQDPIQDLNPGGIIKVKVTRKRCVKGVSGRHKVTAITGTSTYQTDTRFCCAPADLAGLTGEGYKLTTRFYFVPNFNAERVVKHNTGRAFFATRGRQQSRCC